MDSGRHLLPFLLVHVVLYSVSCLACSQAPQQEEENCKPSGTLAVALSGVQPLQSPEVRADGQVALRLCSPDAASVRVMGDWNSKQPDRIH